MTLEEDIINAINTLEKGGIILYPTDTVWGLGCDATNQAAVDKIFRIKNRNENKSLIILVDSEEMLRDYVNDVPDVAFDILDVTQIPVTIIYPGGKNLSEGVCSEDGSAGIRICHDKFCHEMIGKFGRPVVSTSANLSRQKAPENFSEIKENIIGSADYVVSYRRDEIRKSKPSPVIKILDDGTIKILRK
jgi:L-threonylcarbamoyladenylate synthase